LRSRVPVSHVPVIHAVTNDRILASPEFLARSGAVMDVLRERGAIHLRGAGTTGARLFDLALRLREMQERSGCWLIINDRVDIALAALARGAQLTSHSIRPADARAMAPALPLGASVHTAGEARDAEAAHADWIVAGHVFPTTTHPGTPGRGVGYIQQVVGATSLPCLAIGGVRPEHVATLRATGVHGVAAISGIWGADDAERAAREYLSAYDEQRGP
jgi:thiazole tautomerase (transcriptional regulator TenI)